MADYFMLAAHCYMFQVPSGPFCYPVVYIVLYNLLKVSFHSALSCIFKNLGFTCVKNILTKHCLNLCVS